MIKTFFLLFKYAKHPLLTFLNYLFSGKGTLTLRNGIKIKFKKGSGEISAWCNALEKGWVVKKKGKYFIFQNKDWMMIQPNIGVLGEDFEKDYGIIDYKEKIVADVGAYFGETAVFFHKKGAKKVLCFEPLKEHLFFHGFWLKKEN